MDSFFALRGVSALEPVESGLELDGGSVGDD